MENCYGFILENLTGTNNCLLRDKVYAINESDAKGISNNLLAKLFSLSAKKYDSANYGAIHDTKGDITKLKELETLEESLRLVNQIRVQSNISEFNELDNTLKALKYLKINKDIFVSGYRKDNQLLMMLYDNIAMAIVQYSTHLLNAAMSFTRHPNEKTFTMSLNNVESISNIESLLYKNICRFIKSIETGKLNKLFDNIQFAGKKNFTGAAAFGVGGAIIGMGLLVILIGTVILIRELTYYFYASRIKLSDHLKAQALFVEMNVINTKMKSEGVSPKYMERQEKVHDLLLSLADKIDVSDKIALRNSGKAIDSDKVSLDEMKEVSIMDSDIVF